MMRALRFQRMHASSNGKGEKLRTIDSTTSRPSRISSIGRSNGNRYRKRAMPATSGIALTPDGACCRERIGADRDVVGHGRVRLRKTPRRTAHFPKRAQRIVPDECWNAHRPRSGGIADELEKVAVRIAEVDADALAA